MATKQKCMIIGAVPIVDAKLFEEYKPEEYYVICADRGYETALQHRIRPDLIVGDFDSAQEQPPDWLNCMVLPVKKDVTDTMYAAMRGITMGYKEFVLLGCLGGERFDHSIANIEVLQYIVNNEGIGELADEHTRVILLKERHMRITQSKGRVISVFPYNGSSCNVTYAGLEYPLKRKNLHCGGTLMGVSNRIIEDVAAVTVHTGTALIIMQV